MRDIWNYTFDWVKIVDNNGNVQLQKIERVQDYTVDDVNDTYFKFQKGFSGITYNYINDLDDIYKFDKLSGDGVSIVNTFNEYDIITAYLQNQIEVDIASTENIDLNNIVYKIDNITLLSEHLVLLKDQTDTKQNNIYKLNDKGYLILTDYLSDRTKSYKFKAIIKLGDINKYKQWFLNQNNDIYPILNEKKTFIEKHSYMIKNKFKYDLANVTSELSATTSHKLLFSDYKLARMLNTSNNNKLWNNVNINLSVMNSAQSFIISYYNQNYNISFDKTTTPYDYYQKNNINLIPNTTSANTKISSSSEYSSQYQSWCAFNYSNTISTWRSTSPNCWIKYNFTSQVIIWKYSITFYDENINSSPKDWIFEGSNGSGIWYKIDEQYAQTGWNLSPYREYETNNFKKYQYYRLNISDNNGDQFTSISKIKMFDINFVSGLTKYINYTSNRIFNSILNNKNITKINTTGFLGLTLVNGEYLEIEMMKNNKVFLKFNSSITNVSGNTINISDILPIWTLADINNNSGLTWIIRNLQHTNPTISGLTLAINNSFFNKYIDLTLTGTTLGINTVDYNYNKIFSYDSLNFNYNNNNYKFSTTNRYINYKYYDFLNKIKPSTFTTTYKLYNNSAITNFTHYYIDNDIIRIDSTNISDVYNFKPYTYVEISGSTHNNLTMILAISGKTILLQKPSNFNFHETITNIKNIPELKRISDILYEVYKGYYSSATYFKPINESIVKNIYISYGEILHANLDVRNNCVALLTETNEIKHKFILKIYNFNNDSNFIFGKNYIPIEILNIGVDKKTMFPVPININNMKLL